MQRERNLGEKKKCRNGDLNLLRKCIAEFIGAFTIIFGGCGAAVANAVSDGAVSHVGVAISFGLIVMVMIYSLGHISGAHFNPAVTISFALVRHFPVKETIDIRSFVQEYSCRFPRNLLFLTFYIYVRIQ